MRNKFIFSVLLLVAVLFNLGLTDAQAATSVQISAPGISVDIAGYLPAPPGVVIFYEAERPYYVERDKRIYMKKKPDHDHKKEKKHNHGKHKGHHK